MPPNPFAKLFRTMGQSGPPKKPLHFSFKGYPGNPTPGTSPPRPASAPDFNTGWQISVTASTALGGRNSSTNKTLVDDGTWLYPPGTLLHLNSVLSFLGTWADALGYPPDVVCGPGGIGWPSVCPWYAAYKAQGSILDVWMRWDGTLLQLPGVPPPV